tara:strand:- start:866 stop:1681 length:816 start_codon:yes stop_codon:yes gene_type:complete
MSEDKNLKQVIEFGEYLYKVGEKLHGEILGHDYLLEEDLQSILGPRFLKENLPMLRELNIHREIFGLTWKEGIKPDFTFFANDKKTLPYPVIVEFKHLDKLKDDNRKELIQQLKYGQNTVLAVDGKLEYGFLWNIVKNKYEISNEKLKLSELHNDLSINTQKDFTNALEKINKFKKLNEKEEYASDLIYSVLKGKKEYLDKFKEEIDTTFNENSLSYSKLINIVDEYNTQNNLVEGSLFGLKVENTPKVELELWRIVDADKNLSMELVKVY